MVNMQDIDAVEDWLIEQALGSALVPDMFGEMCRRLRDCQVPVDRAMLAWATLHPLIRSEIAFWQAGEAVRHERIEHSETDGEAWLASPMRALLDSAEPMLRRRLDQANAEHNYPLCQELAEAGYTDYLVLKIHFDMPAIADMEGKTGIIVSWATRTPGGFPDDALHAIHYIQKRLALAARANLEAQITKTIAETYLGAWAGSKVLSGQIRHGDGETIKAVIFYCDMRNSTSIAEDLGPDRYLKFLNTYFDVTAGAVLKEGGEVLDFIGDAVLGVFPISDMGLEEAARRAIAAADEVRSRLKELNRKGEEKHPLKVGMALSVGDVMFGNIGVSTRLTFSVIGQTVHAAARIEALTKAVGVETLMTRDIADLVPDRQEPAGSFELTGFASKRPLFSLKPAS
ncbi:adenylate/guanylate cyclase domain-containing protein [Roseibium aggregatum]|uniref:Adenylate/guanylate cyclase domain-containing protein n=1 Tax=Roseibium aggregatum TaxID=187304 RepID=A0A926P3S0_9HYPH|nr:adenylate/guanylate cyclase domain-containing protein [Roseibium aggregatum]MBD1549153.1 adenylate/guanylate cyclase domain-containing protein [Roseibium aggregatum]